MAKIQFDIKYRDKIESGEYKVFAHEHEEQEARIVCWDNKGEYPIVALIDNEPEKFDKHGRVPGGNRGGEFNLFIVTPEPEFTEFEKRLWEIMKSEGSPIGSMDKFTQDDERVFHAYSNQLLELARKELSRQGNIVLSVEDFEKRHIKAQEVGRKEALKDLPRWKRAAASFGDYSVALTETGALCLLIDGHYIMLSELMKLPGFNDDEH